MAILYFLPNVATAQHSITLTPQKGDALYIGVDNPILVKVEGIADDQVYLASDGVEIENQGNGLYNVLVSNPGKATFTVHGEGFQYKNFDVEVKRIADPLAALKLENGEVKKDGALTAAAFKMATGVGFETDGYQGQLQLEIVTYTILRVPKQGDVIEVLNTGANLSKKAIELVKMATPGDTFYFENVQANVTGANEPRKMNSLVFKIK
ncbi:MAG: hypothetical protein IPM82_18695 [Saprospiraceae bacterium]|nr:hypothetical protein [Saprospiraceae bacterium]